MGKTAKRPTTYVVYPAALFDGWEVVKDGDENPECFDTRESATSYAVARAVREGGAIVKLENWFGDTVSLWKMQPSQ